MSGISGHLVRSGWVQRAAQPAKTCEANGGHMSIPIARSQGTAREPGAARHTVLLTGASGVVGRALLRRLRDLDVVCLVHRSLVSGPNVTTVAGDIAKPMFGLTR